MARVAATVTSPAAAAFWPGIAAPCARAREELASFNQGRIPVIEDEVSTALGIVGIVEDMDHAVTGGRRPATRR